MIYYPGEEVEKVNMCKNSLLFSPVPFPTAATYALKVSVACKKPGLRWANPDTKSYYFPITEETCLTCVPRAEKTILLRKRR
jgi:hypothetical protein